MQALVSVNLVVFLTLNVHTRILSVREVILSTFLEFLLTLMVVKTPVVVPSYWGVGCHTRVMVVAQSRDPQREASLLYV
jgi:hypothetical protein